MRGAVLSGEIGKVQWRHYQAKLTAMRNFDPFHFRYLPATVFSTALRQHRHPQSVYCRSLDLLHLAAMEELNLNRLMTSDETQAEVASGLNYKVILPGRD